MKQYANCFKKIIFFIVIISFIFSSFMLLSCKSLKERELILASTTSTADSGLFDEIIPVFEKKTGYNVKLIAVGTGEAIKLGERGEADVLFVHSREAEDKFMEEGFGDMRKDVMYNDFILAGPQSDPAGLKGNDVSLAFKKIAETCSLFVSRADDSGTNKKEVSLWSKTGFDPSEKDWYIQSGQGMGETLQIANEKQAYTLADRGTWLAMADNFDLEILVEGDEILFNPYGVIAVSIDKFKNINHEGAAAFIEFVTSSQGQEIIKNLGVKKYGQPLFYPDAD